MSLQERTLVIKNFDPERTTHNLLKELCLQGGPVRNVVIKPDHAFVEYEDAESVGYSKALLDGVSLFGKNLIMEPKLKTPPFFKYTQLLRDYINYDKQTKAFEEQQRRMMLANQQAPVFAYPQNPVPIYFDNPDPGIFNLPRPIADPQAPGMQVPSTSGFGNQTIHRSHSFNHREEHMHHRGNKRPFNNRRPEWTSRRK